MKIRAKSCLVLKCPSKFLLTCSTHAVDFVTQHKDGDDHQIQLVLSALKSCKKCQGVTLCLIITVSFLLRRILRIGSWEISLSVEEQLLSHAFMFVRFEGSTRRPPFLGARSAKPLWRLFTDYCLAKGERRRQPAKRERIETASYKRHTRILPLRCRTNGWCTAEGGMYI